MNEQQQGAVARPAGTRALIYAVLSLAALFGTYVFALVVVRVVDGYVGLVLLGAFLVAAQAVVALVVGVVQRLAGQRTEAVDLRRIAVWAVGVPVAVTVLGLLVDLLAG